MAKDLAAQVEAFRSQPPYLSASTSCQRPAAHQDQQRPPRTRFRFCPGRRCAPKFMLRRGASVNKSESWRARQQRIPGYQSCLGIVDPPDPVRVRELEAGVHALTKW